MCRFIEVIKTHQISFRKRKISHIGFSITFKFLFFLLQPHVGENIFAKKKSQLQNIFTQHFL